MLQLVLILLVVFVLMTAVIWGVTRIGQGLLYNDPVDGLVWRAPAAATVLTGFVGLWCLLNYSSLGPNDLTVPLDTVFRFQPTQNKDVDRFWSVRQGKEILFKRYDTGRPGTFEFRDAGNSPWRKADTDYIMEAIVIEEDGRRTRFEPELTKEGLFVSQENFPPYYEVGGRRVMEQPGRLSVLHRGLWLLNVLLNLLHFGLWFACLWLLLRFQWLHALGLAVVLWLIMTLFPLAMVLDRTLEAVRPPVTSQRP
ncbi:MAG: hypothetical protein JNM56_01790 [Planctomycetia bacterium]|nr:hypothetical protein [Planctomycetia bacterium]